MRTFPLGSHVSKYLSEMLGTFILVLVGPGSIVVLSSLGLPSNEALLAVAVVFGGTVAAVILSLGRFSGAHINPAITIGSMLTGSFDSALVLPYLVFQLSGALLAGMSLKIALGQIQGAVFLGSTKLAPGVTTVEGTVLEIVGTYVLTMSALLASSYLETPFRRALLVGGTLVVLIMLIGPFTGASFNPARSMGPSIFSGYFSNQLVYYAGPVLGAALAGLTLREARSSFDR